jgi:hypothetical protein
MGIDRSNDIAIPKPEINVYTLLRSSGCSAKPFGSGLQAESSAEASGTKSAVDMLMSVSGMAGVSHRR